MDLVGKKDIEQKLDNIQHEEFKRDDKKE